MSQETLAAMCQLSRTSMSNIEAGRQRVPIHKLYAIGLALQFDPRQFLPEPEAQSAEPGAVLREFVSDEDIAAVFETGSADAAS